MFAQVALPLHFSEPFTYRIPSHLEGKIDLGFRVLVPLRKKIVTGFVVGLTEKANGMHHMVHTTVPNIKEIIDLLDPYPLFSKEMLELTRWVSKYYLCSWGEVLRAALPSELMVKSQMWIKRMVQSPGSRVQFEGLRIEGQGSRTYPGAWGWGFGAGNNLSPRQEKIMEILSDGKERKISWFSKNLRTKGIYADIYDLSKRGKIEINERLGKPGVGIKYEKMVRLKNFNSNSDETELWELAMDALKKKSPLQAECLELILQSRGELSWAKLIQQHNVKASTLNGLKKRGLIELAMVEKIRESDWSLDLPETQSITLNEEQKTILEKITPALEKGVYSPFLIHGITGSGKTQVYIEAIKEVLKKGKQALILVPEISLTPQIISRFKANFGEKVGCFHSRLSAGERFDAWRRIRNGELPIVVGARSAVFAPFQDLGVMVVDEEHDSSYKQDDPAPRYNARDVAVMRAKINNAVVILGSATPSLESYSNAQNGKYTLCQLTVRVDNQKLPSVKIVDLMQERKNGNRNSLSSNLSSLLKDRMDKGEQALLFLNRRGFSAFVKCQDCGHIEKCPRCNITLTFHRTDFSLRCHYCNYQKKAPQLCPNCQGFRFIYKGMGTQKIEEELKRDFPLALMERMDFDTMSRKGAHQRILSDFGKKKFNILLGTQMITKGLDFPDVTLVGVISADMSLDFPDFRSKERTFQLLAQVAGRAGRGKQEGEVMVQTYYPEEWAIKLAASHDFEGFYRKEMEQRRELNYPPFKHLILVVFSDKSLKGATAFAGSFSFKLRENIRRKRLKEVEILGPAPAPLSKIKNQYRWQLLIKTKSAISVSSLLRNILTEDKIANMVRQTHHPKRKAVRIIVNVDPMGML